MFIITIRTHSILSLLIKILLLLQMKDQLVIYALLIESILVF